MPGVVGVDDTNLSIDSPCVSLYVIRPMHDSLLRPSFARLSSD